MDSFFGIGIAELFFIAIIALIVLGPERLPGAMRELVKYLRYFRNLSSELTSQFSEEMKMLDDVNPQKIMRELVEDPEDQKEEKEVKKAVTPAKKTISKSATAKPSAKASSGTSGKPSTPKTSTPKRTPETATAASSEKSSATATKKKEVDQGETAQKTTETDSKEIESAEVEATETEAPDKKEPVEQTPTASSTAPNNKVASNGVTDDGATSAGVAGQVEDAGDTANTSKTKSTSHEITKPVAGRSQADGKAAAKTASVTTRDSSEEIAEEIESQATEVKDTKAQASSISAETEASPAVDGEVEHRILPPDLEQTREPEKSTPESTAGEEDSGRGDGDDSPQVVERSPTVSGSVSVNGKRADAED